MRIRPRVAVDDGRQVDAIREDDRQVAPGGIRRDDRRPIRRRDRRDDLVVEVEVVVGDLVRRRRRVAGLVVRVRHRDDRVHRAGHLDLVPSQ